MTGKAIYYFLLYKVSPFNFIIDRIYLIPSTRRTNFSSSRIYLKSPAILKNNRRKCRSKIHPRNLQRSDVIVRIITRKLEKFSIFNIHYILPPLRSSFIIGEKESRITHLLLHARPRDNFSYFSTLPRTSSTPS